MGQGLALAQSPITPDHAENYFSEMSLFFEEVLDFMRTQKYRNEIPYTMAKPERSELCYVSENEGK